MSRKYVTPADPAASISDPSRGRWLPPEGSAVVWSSYWAGLQLRGDVEVSDLPDEAAEPEVPPSEPEAPAAEPEPA